MIRAARVGDEAAIDAFLTPHFASSMFLRANLAQFGLGLGPDRSDDPRATTFWVVEDAGRIRAVFGRSDAGYLMCQAPENRAEDWAAFRDKLVGLKIAGMTGAAHQVKTGLDVLGLQQADFLLLRDEPHYQLDLSNLTQPEGTFRLRPARESDLDMLTQWIVDYDTGVLGSELNEETRRRAAANAKAHINSLNHRILEDNGQPVAKTAFNAALPDIVQIGGVYTPPEHRSKGYARKVVALHLLEARESGVKTAILFASGPAACRAYEAIGFERIGTYTLALLAHPVVIGEAA